MNILLLLPSLIIIILTFFIPIFRYTWLSFHSSSVITRLNEIPNNGANWFRLFEDNRFWQDAFQTIRFSSISVGLELVLGIVIAIVLNKELKNRGLIRTLSLLPWALPTTVMALGWRWIFNSPYGFIERFLIYFTKDPINILGEPSITWLATVVGDVWKTTPFIALILLAGMQSIPYNLYEAFDLEGGKPFKALFKITLPLIEPYLIISILFRTAQAFGVFDLIQVMTGGGPAGSTESLGVYAYLNAMRFLDFGYSSTIMIATFIILIIYSITITLALKYLIKTLSLI
tara:strand:- start:341 stop:1204 length:864 start_codon:yes stop_codon:yes gene_type:complete